MAASAFDVEQARLAAARRLPASCCDDFLRLSRTLIHGPTFQWLLVDAPDERLRKRVMTALNDALRVAGLSTNRLPLSDKIADVAALEARLVKNARRATVVHVIGRPGWFDAARWDAFNTRRERIADQAHARLVFWLDADAIALASLGAPDLWAWRGGVYSFAALAPVPTSMLASSGKEAVDRTRSDIDSALGWQRGMMPLTPRPSGADNRSMAERTRRVAEIRTWLERSSEAPDELLVEPLDELGRLLFDLGDLDAALQHWRDIELPFHRQMGDARAEAITRGRIADVLQRRGQLDEALRIRTEEELPVYERLGDMRSKAVAIGRIADILQTRGLLDEALRIRTEEQLPVYERLDDAREKAVTMGRIADILQVRGRLDEALRIHTEEELPVYERLGDLHAKAVTMGRIADILQVRGRLDEALRIRTEEQLPICERLGDVRSKAVTMGKIADILQIRGQLDEALRIRTQEQLPVYERLDDIHSKAVTMGKIADILQIRGQLKEALRVRTEEQLPVYERLGDVRSKAVTMGKIADILQGLGQLDEALSIRRKEELPVFERLGDTRERAVTHWKIGLQLLQNGDKNEAGRLLQSAYEDFSDMGLPEALSMAARMRELGIAPSDAPNQPSVNEASLP